mmetsp:Transcript_65275/g.155978  ORF Transcript_65275/g.155978 Transcript_65275/m.155978 type:complete len:808 (+) Transcript_65275:158-2581(+)
MAASETQNAATQVDHTIIHGNFTALLDQLKVMHMQALRRLESERMQNTELKYRLGTGGFKSETGGIQTQTPVSEKSGKSLMGDIPRDNDVIDYGIQGRSSRRSDVGALNSMQKERSKPEFDGIAFNGQNGGLNVGTPQRAGRVLLTSGTTVSNSTPPQTSRSAASEAGMQPSPSGGGTVTLSKTFSPSGLAHALTFYTSKLTTVKQQDDEGCATGSGTNGMSPTSTRRDSIISQMTSPTNRSKHEDPLPFARQNRMTTIEISDEYYVPKFTKFVKSNIFEGFFCILIAINALLIAADAQYEGLQVGYDIGFENSVPTRENWPDGRQFFDLCSWVFGIAFVVEILLKLLALRRHFLDGGWNAFDMTIAVLWVLEASESIGNLVNPTLLRIIRLVKLLRLVRLVRTIQAFDALYLMTTALAGSATILAWSAALLIVLLMMFALFANQVLVTSYLDNETIHPDEKLEVYEYFGTFSRALLSMFEMTLANWPPVCRLLVENVSEIWLVPALIHKLTIGFAVVGVINGVFMQETFKVASTDDSIMLRQKQTAIRMHEKKMKHLFDHLDESADGYLDMEEFKEVANDKRISTWLASMDLDASDIETLYKLIDADDDGQITVEELIAGVGRLKGSARSIDLALARNEAQELYVLLQDVLEAVCHGGTGGAAPGIARQKSATRSQSTSARAFRREASEKPRVLFDFGNSDQMDGELSSKERRALTNGAAPAPLVVCPDEEQAGRPAGRSSIRTSRSSHTDMEPMHPETSSSVGGVDMDEEQGVILSLSDPEDDHTQHRKAHRRPPPLDISNVLQV